MSTFYDYHICNKTFDFTEFERFHAVYKTGNSRVGTTGLLTGIAKAKPTREKLVKLKETKKFPGCLTDKQIEYIEQLWGKDWEYLFCHYQNISESDLTHPRIKPVKKVIQSHNPLRTAIRTLIRAENILDDNGELATFEPRLIRETRLTELFLQGHDLSVVSAWAGHRRLATTANFYTQVTCEQIEKEVGHIQSALVNTEGKKIYYESMPKSFWENPTAHELEVAGTHVNTPIYGYCGLDLDQECEKFRACYTCRFFVAKPEKLSEYIKQRDELREKQEQALANGHSVLVEQFSRQADTLDNIIQSLQQEVA